MITLANIDGTGVPFDTYHAFEVSTTGVSPVAVKSTFPFQIGDPRGQIKVSPDGKKFASANMNSGLYLYDFDADTGILSNQQNLSISSISGSTYGVEFSQSSSRLYINSSNDQPATGPPNTHEAILTQFDLEATNVQGSEFTIDQRQLYRGSLQLAPNGKIHHHDPIRHRQSFVLIVRYQNGCGVGQFNQSFDFSANFGA